MSSMTIFIGRRFRAHGIVFAALVGLVRCGAGDHGPTGASDVPGLRSVADIAGASARSQSALASLQGRLTDTVTAMPISSASVRIEGLGESVTGADGSFEIPVDAARELPLSMEAEGYWRRQSRVLTGAGSPIGVDLLPVEGPFDLHFFDHVFRRVGESGTFRWTREPRFEIWTKVFDCLVVERGFCIEMAATDEDATPLFLNVSRDVISTDSAKLTGGAVQGSHVTELSHAPGTVLGGAEELMPAHSITVALVQLPAEEGSWAWSWSYDDGSMYAGHIQISKKHHKLERGVVSHELAHALGYGHPRGGDHVPLPSIMRYGHGPEPSQHDVLHGRVLYQRPPGSRSPDVDPEGYVVNRPGSSQVRTGTLVETLVRN